MKAQAALEYLMVTAISLMVIVPTTYLFYSYSRASSQNLIYPQINDIGRTIISNSESVYFSGEYSKIVLDINIPDDINDVYIIDNRELVFETETDLGFNDLVFFSLVNITFEDCTDSMCNLSSLANSGIKEIKLEVISQGKQVLISEN